MWMKDAYERLITRFTRKRHVSICIDQPVLDMIDAAVPAHGRSRFLALAAMMALTTSLRVRQDYAIAIRKLLKRKK